MKYKIGDDRNQIIMTSLDSYIPFDSDVRVIDAFVDTLDLSSFSNYISKGKGQLSYSPFTLLKIYLLGYSRNIRSSRKLENALNYNLEFMWISNNQKIKHSTIADFRSKNHSLLKDIMFKFNLSLSNFNVISNIDSIDGTKVKAVNSKDNNFTQSKLDDRIAHIKEKINAYEEAYELEDALEDEKEKLENEVNDLKDRLSNYQNMLSNLEQQGENQISLIDSESRLMKNNGKCEVCFNNQVEVDDKSHIVKNFMVSNTPSDLGSLNSLTNETKSIYNIDILTASTDKGYNDRQDMIKCLENGVIPEVTPRDDHDGFELETEYEENEISESDLISTNPNDIKKCLRAAKIPKVYENIITDIEVRDVIITDYSNSDDDDSSSLEEKRDYAMQNDCFVRDIKTNKVFCPSGEILRQKSKNSNNKCRYCNKLACKNCKNPCTTSDFKVVEFSPNQLLTGKKNKRVVNKNKVKRKVKKVIIHTKSNFQLLKRRMATSEHPHASMKFWDNARFLLTKGIKKATGELALYYTAFNIRRACKIINKLELINHFKELNSKNNIINNEDITNFYSNFYFFYNFINFCK